MSKKGNSTLLTQPITSENKDKLKKVISAGMVYMQHIEDTRQSMKEAIESASADLGIDKSIINEVIRTVFKQDYLDKTEKRDEVDAIMSMTGYMPEKD